MSTENPTQTDAHESLPNTEGNPADQILQRLENAGANFENKAVETQQLFQEVGGAEGVEAVLVNMPQSRRDEINAKLQKLADERSQMNESLSNTLQTLTPDGLTEYAGSRDVKIPDIIGSLLGGMTGLLGSAFASGGTFGEQAQNFMNSMEGNSTENQMWVGLISALLVPIAMRTIAGVPAIAAATVTAMHGVAQLPKRVSNLAQSAFQKMKQKFGR